MALIQNIQNGCEFWYICLC